VRWRGEVNVALVLVLVFFCVVMMIVDTALFLEHTDGLLLVEGP